MDGLDFYSLTKKTKNMKDLNARTRTIRNQIKKLHIKKEKNNL